MFTANLETIEMLDWEGLKIHLVYVVSLGHLELLVIYLNKTGSLETDCIG